jgi:hypothetical protein
MRVSDLERANNAGEHQFQPVPKLLFADREAASFASDALGLKQPHRGGIRWNDRMDGGPAGFRGRQETRGQFELLWLIGAKDEVPRRVLRNRRGQGSGGDFVCRQSGIVDLEVPLVPGAAQGSKGFHFGCGIGRDEDRGCHRRRVVSCHRTRQDSHAVLERHHARRGDLILRQNLGALLVHDAEPDRANALGVAGRADDPDPKLAGSGDPRPGLAQRFHRGEDPAAIFSRSPAR